MKTKGDYSAASRKAWRTRKLMKKAREETNVSKPMLDLETGLLRKTELPLYMRRVLPCPNFGAMPDED